MKKIVFTAKEPVTVSLKGYALDDARKAINISVFGDVAVNKIDSNGKIVPKKMSKKTGEKLKEAHYGICRSQQIDIEFDITDDGEFINFRVAK